jgi:type I restriction enzyme S subunit
MKTTIGTHCTVTSSKRFRLSERAESGVPFFCSKQIIQLENGEIPSDYDHITNEHFRDIQIKYGVPSAGDLLITTRGTYGIPYIYKERDCFYFADGNLTWLKDFDDCLSSHYLYYWFKSYEGQKKIDAIAKGTAQKAVPIALIKDLQLSLPPISQQKRIASILSAYDDLIENNRRQIKLLEEAAQRLYREWFVELRFPGHESVKVVDGVPEGWMKGTVDNIVKLLSGYPFKSSEYVSSGKYRLITIKNVKDGEFSPDNVDYIDQLPDKVPSHCILTEGDILLSLTGNIGRVCIVNGYNYLLNQRVAKLQTLHPAYAYCMFRSKEMLNKMTALSNGVAQQNLSPIRAEKIRILIPSSNLLFQFKNIVEPIISQIILLNNQITFACEARDRLLPELMDGEMEV